MTKGIIAVAMAGGTMAVVMEATVRGAFSADSSTTKLLATRRHKERLRRPTTLKEAESAEVTHRRLCRLPR